MIKKLSIILLFIFMGCVVSYRGGKPPYPPPEKHRHYDTHGKYRGYTIKQNGRLKHYSPHGKYEGYSIDRGGSIKHYDRNGRYKGTTRK